MNIIDQDNSNRFDDIGNLKIFIKSFESDLNEIIDDLFMSETPRFVERFMKSPLEFVHKEAELEKYLNSIKDQCDLILITNSPEKFARSNLDAAFDDWESLFTKVIFRASKPYFWSKESIFDLESSLNFYYFGDNILSDCFAPSKLFFEDEKFSFKSVWYVHQKSTNSIVDLSDFPKINGFDSIWCKILNQNCIDFTDSLIEGIKNVVDNFQENLIV
eukprot:TRINITY_DN3326_c4_g1_i11.p1 TRINITY_DN3326_c4_g1~~TRINITY_DN3326_c4_g1_i11.p1  ORF type:complete len:246 (+),score=70.83 TRINITY_DN3326_c4_g1_i11:89-739(+)